MNGFRILQPDITGSIGRGIGVGQLQRQAQKRNALADLYQQQGPGLLAGDPGSLNALSRIAPGRAGALQSAHEQEQAAARKTQMQHRGQIAAALWHVTTPQQFDAAKAALVQTGVLDQADWDKYTFDHKDTYVAAARGLAGEVQDDKDKQAHAEGVRQFNAKFGLALEQLDETKRQNALPAPKKLYNVGGSLVDGQGNVVFKGPGKPGVHITSPDGTEIQFGGSGEQRSLLTKPAQTANQKNIMNAADSVAALEEISRAFNPNYLTVQGQTRNKLAGAMDRFDIASPEQKQLLGKYTQFKTQVTTYMNNILHQLSGAAVSVPEMKRLKESVPTMDNSPTEFRAKLIAIIHMQKLAIARYTMWSRQGLGGKPWQTPLDSMQGIITKRAGELLAKVKQANPDGDTKQIRAEVKRRLKAEFGL